MPSASHTLAVNGGLKVRTQPWPERGQLGLEEKRAVAQLFDRAIASGRAIGYGGETNIEYRSRFAAMMGGGYAQTANSGTSALFVALRALEIPPGSEVIIGPFTDPGGMMPIPLSGCIPVIVDTEVGSYNIGPEQVANAITPRTRAIVVTHNCGEPADVHAIAELAMAENIPLVEDCSQAHGATLKGRLVGTFGHIAVFSTSHFKHHCTGGQGGMVFTSSHELIARARQASDRGKPFDLPEGSSNTFASFNFNLDDLACAIGIEQLKKLPSIVTRRRVVVSQLEERLSQAELDSVRIAAPIAGAEPSYLFLRIRVDHGRLRCDKDTFARALQGEGIPLIPSYARKHMPHTQDWFRHRRVFAGSHFPWTLVEPSEQAPSRVACPNAEAAASEHFLLGIHERWGEQEIADTIAAIQKVETVFAR